MHRAISLVPLGNLLYALRSDGTVFVLMPRGALLHDGGVVADPYWAVCPAIPGTPAAVAQEG